MSRTALRRFPVLAMLIAVLALIPCAGSADAASPTLKKRQAESAVARQIAREQGQKDPVVTCSRRSRRRFSCRFFGRTSDKRHQYSGAASVRRSGRRTKTRLTGFRYCRIAHC